MELYKIKQILKMKDEEEVDMQHKDLIQVWNNEVEENNDKLIVPIVDLVLQKKLQNSQKKSYFVMKKWMIKTKKKNPSIS
jgi:hypothetical protein